MIEILIAALIGVVSMVVIMQIFITFEGKKRSISSGGDAQASGIFALYTLQDDLRQAGYGVSSFNLLGCNLSWVPTAVTPAVTVTLTAMAPVTINHSGIPVGDANTDTLLIVYGNGNGSAEGDIIATSTSPNYSVQTPTAFARNDFVIALPSVRPNPCGLTLAQVTGDPLAVTPPTVTPSAWVAGMTGGTLFNIGNNPRIQAYAIRGGNLTVCDYRVNNCGDTTASVVADTTVWVPIVNDIVSLRAQYGRDTTIPMDGIADVYNQTTPSAGSGFQCNWARISAVRIVVVARNAQYVRESNTRYDATNVPSSEAPIWAGSSINPPGSTVNAIDLSVPANAPPNETWKNEWFLYRYRKFETVVPIRNVLWLGALAGC
ncbi:PilW family protein [uncultured Thiodictyon sp.]|uniref:PilW family protein n=1 Tax=uncultured Thiodictyon sp. TaxID=1846217 RepID=UPI0025E37997|nr:PilW family protein [uncultured Thiodictyon sp.]